MVCVALIAGTYAPDRCGVADYTRRLREGLRQQGVRSLVLTTVKTTVKTDVETDDPTVIKSVQDWNLQNLLHLVRAVHRTNADILHIQHAAGTYSFDRAIFLLPLLLRLSGWRKPIVTTIHEYGWWEWEPKWIPKWFLERLKEWGQKRSWWDREDGFLLTLSDAIVTTNQEAEKVVRDRLPNALIYRIPIGANVEVFPIDRTLARSQLRQTCNWSEAAQVVAFFGFLHPVKGLETLLSAFQNVSSDAKLILMGGVESLALRGDEAKQYWEKLEALISQLNLSDRVHMTGYIDAKTASNYLSGSDIGVLPFNHGVTLKSGSLLTLLAHGLPVIATRSSEDLTVVKSIPAKNIDALTIALNEWLTDFEKRDRGSKLGQEFAQQFDWNAIAASHLKIYESVRTHA